MTRLSTLACVGAMATGLAASAAMAQTNPAPAQMSAPPAPTTQMLYEDCTSQDQGREVSCVSYLSGVADMMRLIGSGIEQHKVSAADEADYASFGICGSSYTAMDLRRTFVDWAAAHPEQSSRYRLFGALRAFHHAWRCR